MRDTEHPIFSTDQILVLVTQLTEGEIEQCRTRQIAAMLEREEAQKRIKATARADRAELQGLIRKINKCSDEIESASTSEEVRVDAYYDAAAGVIHLVSRESGETMLTRAATALEVESFESNKKARKASKRVDKVARNAEPEIEASEGQGE